MEEMTKQKVIIGSGIAGGVLSLVGVTYFVTRWRKNRKPSSEQLQKAANKAAEIEKAARELYEECKKNREETDAKVAEAQKAEAAEAKAEEKPEAPAETKEEVKEEAKAETKTETKEEVKEEAKAETKKKTTAKGKTTAKK